MERQDQSDQPIDWGFDLFEAATRAGVTFAEEATPTDRFVDANGLRFHYLEWGAPEATPIVMLHGFAQTAHTWDFLALYLSGRYRVIALDQRGHGDSDWAPDGSYTLDDHQADLKAIVTALELSDTVFIGLSMGGRNAYVYAADNPGDVKALVIVDSAPVHERAGADTVRRFVSGSDEMDSVEEFVERVRRYSRAAQKIASGEASSTTSNGCATVSGHGSTTRSSESAALARRQTRTCCGLHRQRPMSGAIRPRRREQHRLRGDGPGNGPPAAARPPCHRT